MNAFEAYAKRTSSTAAPRLIGVMRTRTEARQRYVEIVELLTAVTSQPELEHLLSQLKRELIQFEIELPFLWEGDGDFAGLQQEIERAQVRLDAGLDHPRLEP